MVTDGYDAIAPTVKYLNWSSYNRTLILLQISLLITTLMFFFGPLIPIRPILFLVGEGAFIINHPWTQPALEGLITSISKSKDGRKLKMKSKHLDSKLREWLEMDRLDDQVWENGFKDIEMWENERWYSDSLVGKSNPKAGAGTTGNDGKNWSSHNLNYGERKPWTKGSDGWSSEELEVTGYSLDISKQVATALEPGWRWVEGDDWRIDWIGNWSSVGVDDGECYRKMTQETSHVGKILKVEEAVSRERAKLTFSSLFLLRQLQRVTSTPMLPGKGLLLMLMVIQAILLIRPRVSARDLKVSPPLLLPVRSVERRLPSTIQMRLQRTRSWKKGSLLLQLMERKCWLSLGGDDGAGGPLG